MLTIDDILTDLERCVVLIHDEHYIVYNAEIETVYFDGRFDSYNQVADAILTSYEEEGVYESTDRESDLEHIKIMLKAIA